MPSTFYTSRRALIDRFVTPLTAAVAQRHQRGYWGRRPDGGEELGWILFEREQMLAAVNEARAEEGLPPVTVAAVWDAECAASGHADYIAKFALYCAELALGDDPDRESSAS